MTFEKLGLDRLKLFSVFLLALLFSCKPPHKVENIIPDQITGAFIVLNEGLFQNNNSSLTYFNWYTHQNSAELFEQKNGIGMGDTGNDLAIYGEKIYVLMNNSHVLHVLNRRNGKLIEQVSLWENGIGVSPRQLAFHAGKLYFTAFNGFLYQMDTVNFDVENKLQLGANPDHVLLHNNELWVSNSGGLVDFGDSTVSVVDLNTFSEIDRLVVGRNPGSLASDGTHIYVVSRGDYVSIPSRLVKVNLQSKVVVNQAVHDLTGLCYYNNRLFAMGYDYTSASSSLRELNRDDLSFVGENLISNLSIQTLYGFQKLDVLGQEIYAFMDARQYIHQGNVFITDQNFQILFSIQAGLNPSKIVFNAP